MASASDYDEIYSRFYLKVKDYEIIALDEQLAKEVLNGYLRSVLAKPFVRRLFASIDIDDDIEELEYSLRDSLGEDMDKDFVEEVLAVGMVEEWASPRYHSTLLTSQLLSNSEQKWYSQAQQLAEMKALYLKAQNDLRKLIRDWGWSKPVINGVAT